MSDFELIMGARKGGWWVAADWGVDHAWGAGGEFEPMLRAMLKRVLKSTLVVITTIVALMTLAAGPALAHYTEIYHGSGHAWVSADHRTLGVQDNACDGHRVFAQIHTSDFSFYWRVYDANDCAEGASFFTTYNSDIFINLYRLCEESSVGCSSSKTP